MEKPAISDADLDAATQALVYEHWIGHIFANDRNTIVSTDWNSGNCELWGDYSDYKIWMRRAIEALIARGWKPPA